MVLVVCFVLFEGGFRCCSDVAGDDVAVDEEREDG
jgi:hypothetical protein